ncbi:DUF5723 family protein [Ferruginibacter albus]|uniref:DUF5723 family protein n=1 Tax=Ferruginibacter albus TaxID=2875540 RepID=UPI001CC40C0D|nr:DUF5723 family protein [Ferruginibacter albus]UAY52909.1 DUF5723 family protein [Ferruginibacter albus]
MKKAIVFAASVLFFTNVFSQTYSGYNTSNYTGVNGVFFNPANIADSRYSWDVNLLSVNATVATDYASIQSSKIISALKGENIAPFITRKGLLSTSGTANVDIFGPSFMINYDKKNSFAFTTRMGAMVNIDDMPDTLLNAIENHGVNITNFPITMKSDAFAGSYNAWTEFGLSYARVIKDDKKHFFKGGITLKYLGGVGSGYFISNSFQAIVGKNGLGDTYLRDATADLYFANAGITDKLDLKLSGSGFGGDLGFVYEYRPDNFTKTDIDQYKLKIDLALHDIGSISYDHSATDAYYKLNTNTVPAPFDTLRLARFNNVTNFDEMTAVLDGAAPKIQKQGATTGKYSMSLPASLSAAIDYNFFTGFNVNLGGMLSLNSGKSTATRTHVINYLALTPRYERKSFGVYLPLLLNEISGFNAGISFRAGPVFFGSGSILSTLISGNTRQIDFHAGLRFGMLRKDKKAKQPKAEPAKGKIIDTDMDGIADKDDKCPTVAGLEKYNGCPIPDSDSDGINDEQDKCPTVVGLEKYNGCPIPDTDGDGINDEADKCPNVAGIAKYNGCPIPDTDNDGVNDEEDKCPTVAGVAKYNGCPIPDTDKDGVNDEEDKCPTLAGTAANHGCPEIKEAVKKRIDVAASRIYFATGSAKLLATSNAGLNIVAAALKADPNLKIDINGHTDNVGKPEKNQLLSEARAKAVYDYLVKKGVDANRLTSKGFGDTQPIADNKTAAGRTKNRRVELQLHYY